MGTPHLSLLSSSPSFSYYSIIINPRKPSLNPNYFPSKFHPSPSPNCSWGTISNAFRGDRFHFEDEFRSENRRNWWSDDDDDDEEEEEEDDAFGFFQESSSFDWIFKVFRAFGWMVPAVIISTLLGTGTNSLIMALVLPLGQTALSLVLDKLWEGPISSPNPGPRSRSRPSPGFKTRSRSRAEKDPYAGMAYGNQRNAQPREARTRRPNGRGGYQSWGAASNSSATKGGASRSRFGGWDELDKQVRSNNSFSMVGQSAKVDRLQRQQIWPAKLSRGRNREKPLFMRLLIAVFPILGSWTRFLF